MKKSKKKSISRPKPMEKIEIKKIKPSMKYYGRERVCKSLMTLNETGKTLNLGAGEMQWIENDLFLNNKNFISSDVEQKNLGSANLAKNKMVINAEKIPFKNNELSQVILLDVLEHIKNHHKVVEEIHRVLKKGGKFIICVPNDTLLSYLNPIRYTQHERHYTIKHITSLLKSKGFKIEKMLAGGSIFDLMDFYIHIFVKYTTGRKIRLKFFDKLRDSEYKEHHNSGAEIAIRAVKI